MFILDPSQIVRLLGKQYFIHYSKSESQYKLFDQSVIVDEKNEISIYSWINAFVAKTYAQLAEKQISLCKVGTLLLGLSIALPLDSLLLRGASAGPAFRPSCGRA